MSLMGIVALAREIAGVNRLLVLPTASEEYATARAMLQRVNG